MKFRNVPIDNPDFDYTADNGTDFSVAMMFKTPTPDASGFGYVLSQGGVFQNNSLTAWFCGSGSCDDLFDNVPGSGDGAPRVGIGTSDGFDVVDTGSFSELANDEWHVLVATLESGVGMSVYVDGVHIETVAGNTTTGTFDPDTDLFFGGRSDRNADRYYEGGIDEVVLFNYALDQADVSSLYAAVPEPASALTLWVGAALVLLARRRVKN